MALIFIMTTFYVETINIYILVKAFVDNWRKEKQNGENGTIYNQLVTITIVSLDGLRGVLIPF